jgi:hypothetical protein
MADVKISGLPASTTPLAGTEVLPVVQSGITKKVASDDLTVKNVRSNATTGILQVTGPAAAATRVMTVPDANFTAARTDAAQSFTGDQTLSTGNLVIGTSGKGIDFSATAGTGTSELFADYEEGTFSPTIVGSTADGTATYASQIGSYTKVGNIVQIQIYLSWSGHTGTGNMRVEQLPFTQYPVSDFHASPAIGFFVNIALTAGNIPQAYGSPNTTRINIGQIPTGGGAFTSCPMDAAGELMMTMVYRV